MPLITLSEYKKYASKNNPEHDETLTQIIDGVSDLVKAYCGRDFVRESYNEELDVDLPFTSDLFVRSIPVVSVTEIRERGEDEDFEVVDPSVYRVNKGTGRISRLRGYWPQGISSVEIDYEGGLEGPPADVKLACYELVNYYFKRDYVPRKQVQNSTKENSEIEHGLPVHIATILNGHRYLL